jgi:isopenicillin N synthase-like dioxygenase
MLTFACEMKTEQIPVLDLRDFKLNPSSFSEAIGNAFHDIGFVSITNHGINNSLIDNVYSDVYDFFKLDNEQKKQYERSNGGQRGYTSFGKEHAKGNPNKDLKEFWHTGREIDNTDPLTLSYPQNILVKEVETFNQTTNALYLELENLGNIILEAISLYLKLPQNYFKNHTKNGNSILRAIHYPSIQEEPLNSIRAAAHEDINLITLLLGASAEGLQVLNSNNQWISINNSHDSIVINVGDMLQRLTNNRLKSTTHRVVNPPKDSWHIPRFSIPFFLHPRPEMDLTCLDSCINENNPLAFSSITAGEYLNQRLKEIGLIS